MVYSPQIEQPNLFIVSQPDVHLILFIYQNILRTIFEALLQHLGVIPAHRLRRTVLIVQTLFDDAREFFNGFKVIRNIFLAHNQAIVFDLF